MTSQIEKKELILAQERIFAAQLGRHVLSKPKLHTWMILIPFLFIFFIQDLMKYKAGKKSFTENYLLSHEKALTEAMDALAEEREPDTEAIARKANLKGTSQEKYTAFLAVLVVHYTSLLEASGNTYESLLKSAYGNSPTNFLLFINQITQAERKLNQTLTSQLSEEQEDVNFTIKKMEVGSKQLRRSEAEQIFGAI